MTRKHSDAVDYAGRWRDDAGVIGAASELERQLTMLGIGVYRVKRFMMERSFVWRVYSEEPRKKR